MRHITGKRYQNYMIRNFLQQSLPMDEFLQGNFSRAWEIVHQYSNFLIQCFTNAKVEYIGTEHRLISDFIDNTVQQLGKEKEELEKVLADITTEEVTKENEINAYFTTLLATYPDSEDRNAICSVYKKTNYDTDSYENEFHNLEYKNPQKHEKYLAHYHNLQSLELYQTLSTAAFELRIIKHKKSKQKKLLEGKADSLSNKNQLEYNSSWKHASDIISSIRTSIEKVFLKKDMLGDLIDDRDLFSIFLENITAQIINSPTTPKRIRKQYIERYQDKYGFFEYLLDMYQKLAYEELRIKSHIESAGSEDISGDVLPELRMITYSNVVEVAHETCGDTAYQPHPLILNAAVKVTNTLRKRAPELNRYRDNLSDEDIEYVYTIIVSPKTQPWNMQRFNDERTKKIFRLLRDTSIDDEGLIENVIEELWNADFFKLLHTTAHIHDILVDLYAAMSTSDTIEMYAMHKHEHSFHEIIELAQAQKKKDTAAQLELFPLTQEQQKDIRIDKLKALIENQPLLPRMSADEKDVLQWLVFADKKRTFPHRYKRTRWTVNIKNRKSHFSNQSVVRSEYLQMVLHNEQSGDSLNEALMPLIQYITYGDFDEPLYETTTI